ncbi:membrane-bound PQQ-dependent dehydrogenase, glucose/quinate/shikimate family [Psychrobacter sp. FBL11]|uniref:Membrane-bound PQQ-dependent dehydrogenase, glucose/quinate/shikimate family n=1 Tax=Psychrobacter saeujeotis TaxID=3143436 RepID=A0ABU9XAN9_9GAMM|nr:membrane-bound PQQ-dependent dehydrogenase, glucose/quinate/shikimate family [uncultured Psychrobacter sp.]
MIRVILAILILILGVALAIGGIWLISLGGSWGYVILAIPLIISAILLLRRQRSALVAYAIVIIISLIWALWEVGFDWWAMAPREGLIVLLGIIMLLPPVVRSLESKRAGPGQYSIESKGLMGVMVVGVVIAIISFVSKPHEIDGDLAAERMASGPAPADDVKPGEWAAYGRTSAGQRYSPLDQINTDNVGKLEKVWEYHAGDDIHPDLPGSALESTPLIVNDTMYVCTPKSEVIALDPVTGDERWRFDPKLLDLPSGLASYTTCRGVSYDDGSNIPVSAASAPLASADEAEALLEASRASATQKAAGVAQNILVDRAKPNDPNPIVPGNITSDNASIRQDCRQRVFITTRDARLIALSAETGVICPGFGGDDGTVNLWQGMPNISPGAYYSTSPGLIADDVIVVGGAINDNVSTTLPSGVVRAFDLATGDLVWNFDAANPTATAPIKEGETYTENAPNSWSVSSYDADLGLVYVPFGVGSPDQYGIGRSEAEEEYSTSITALDVATGEPRWTFQTVHHDLWDYDVPAQPSLIDLTIEGKKVPALVQPTKQGEVFVLNRATGDPVLPVEEVAVPQSGGIEGEPLSPTQPVSKISFAPKEVTGAQMWGMTPVDQMLCRIDLAKLNYEGRFTPPSLNGTLTHPGSFGVLNWGAVAVDPARQMLFSMPVYLGFTAQLVERPDSLEKVVSRPGDDVPIGNENFGAPYGSIVKPFMSRVGLPCQQPPWGYVQGVDLTNGETVYRRVNGTVRDMAPVPLPFKTGVPGIGGPIVTAGGVAFLSGTVDYYVRGYDLANGNEIWRARLPAGGQSTPATYLGRDGRQYLVVVAGGHRYTGTKTGDSVIAYALPESATATQ